VTVSLNSNIASVVGQRRLADTSNPLTHSLERLSSGSRINRASDDDVVGFAVADTLRSKARVYTQGARNLNDGISVLSIADQALDNLSRMGERQREQALQSANGILSSTQREALDTEAQALRSEYQRIIAIKFNRQGLLDRSLAGLDVHAGYGTDGMLSLEVTGLSDEESTVLEDDILSPGTNNFEGVVTLAKVQFYVHDFNGDGV
jgi:flagellin